MSGERSGAGGKETRRVAHELRERIIALKYPKGTRLAAQRELATEFGVSRDTVQRALRELVDEGWIRSQQGSGSYVIREPEATSEVDSVPRMRRLGLRPFLEQALAEQEMSLDVYCLTSESLDTYLSALTGHLQGEAPAEPGHDGLVTVPRRIHIRMLLPARTTYLPYPRSVAEPDDTRVTERLWDISELRLRSLGRTLRNLLANGLVEHLDFEVKRVPIPPVLKLYILNRRHVFQAPYKLVRRRIPLDGAVQQETEFVEAIDVLSLGATGTYFDKGTETTDAQAAWVDDHQAWFDSLWECLGE